MLTSSFLLAAVGVICGQQPASQVILGADGHGQLIPPLEQTALSTDGHVSQVTATAMSPTPISNSDKGSPVATTTSDEQAVITDTRHSPDAATATEQTPLLGGDGHGQQQQQQPDGGSEEVEVVTETVQTPLLGGDGHGQQQQQHFDGGSEEAEAVTATAETPASDNAPDAVGRHSAANAAAARALEAAASTTDDDDTDDDDSYWTFTHYSNDTVCWAGTGDADDDGALVGGEETAQQWCASKRAWYMFAFTSHVMFWTVVMSFLLMAYTIHKRGKQNRELRNRMAVMEINCHDFGDFVQTASAGDDRIELVPPTYNQGASFPEKPSHAGGGRLGWMSSVA
jgi:hypothetical protein